MTKSPGKSPEKEILLSGIRASGQPHIGNYLGKMKKDLESSQEYDSYFFIADLHSLTTPFEPKELHKSVLDIAAAYLALGFNPKKAALFLQSQNPNHSELAWILSCITPLGELERMTQFKEKSSDGGQEHINAGLLTYPILMAADILIYKAKHVTVGEDQLQHLEFSRTLARKFNSRFGKVFPEPQPLLSHAVRVKSLTNPEKKMSKTGDEALLIDDSPTEIKRKLKKAVTASDGRGKSAGVENLMLLLAEFGTQDQIRYFTEGLNDNTIKFSELKETLAEDIAEHFAEFREKKKEILAQPEHIAEVLADGAARAQEVTQQTMEEVKQKLGLL